MSAVRRVDGRRRRRGVLDRRHAGPRPREDLALHGDGARRLAEAEAHGRRARIADRREGERVARGRQWQIERMHQRAESHGAVGAVLRNAAAEGTRDAL